MNNAVINFLFNSQGAIKELDNFKNNFTKSIDALSNSSIGKLGKIGATLGSIFSVKKFIDTTKAVRDLHDQYNNLPLEQISQFVNRLKLLGGTEDEAINFLDRMQSALTDFNMGKGGVLSNIMNALNINIGDIQNASDLIDRIYEGLSSGKIGEMGFQSLMSDLGVSNVASLNRYMRQTREEFVKTAKEAESMGIVSQKEVDMINKYQRAMARLEGTAERFGRTLMDRNLSGLIDAVTGSLEWFVNQEESTQNAILGVLAVFTLGGPILAEVKIWTNAIIGMFQGVASAYKGVLQLLTSPIGTALGIAGLVYAIENDVGGIRTALEEVIVDYDNFVKKFSKKHPLAGSFLHQIKEFLDAIAHPLDSLKTAFSNIWNIFTGKGEVVDVNEMNDKLTQEHLANSTKKGAISQMMNKGANSISNAVTYSIDKMTVVADNVQEFGKSIQNQTKTPWAISQTSAIGYTVR